jgi:O-antigen ligase
MTDRIPKMFLVLLGGSGATVLAMLAYARPGYFTAQSYAEWLLLLEFLVFAIWMYRPVFFPTVLATFLFAGIDVPFQGVWNAGRWAFLGLGALVGWTLILKDRRFKFGLFHGIAFLAILGALVSCMESRHAGLSGLKVLSLLLLFVYTATGARLAVAGRESQFFSGLLVGLEVFVVFLGLSYLWGGKVMGSPNSLGAVAGVVTTPILFWAMLVSECRAEYYQRLAFFAFSWYLTFISHARAGMLAAFCSCALLCIALRKYRLLIQGLGIVLIIGAAAAILQPDALSNRVSELTSTVIFKNGNADKGILASRENPWHDAIETIRTHFWFGTGFGTSDTGQDLTASLAKFSTVSVVSAEHGSSYLAITSWVGILGVIPFALLLCLLLIKTVQTVIWMRRTGKAFHPAVPLAIVIVAGLLHAGFEDWLFAPGYYLCVLFWSFGFMLVDYVPKNTSYAPSLPVSVASRAA